MSESYTIHVTMTPTIRDLETWWIAMQEDDLSVTFSDAFPKTLGAFQDDCAQGVKHIFLGKEDGNIVGALWLYALEEQPCWVGAYVLPHYRGTTATLLAFKSIAHARAHLGIHEVYAAAHEKNFPLKIFTQRIGFALVGYVPKFSRFQGELVGSNIYTLHREHAQRALLLAQAHALVA